MAETPYMKRGWEGDKTQPLNHRHLSDPDSDFTINGGSNDNGFIPTVIKLANGDYVSWFEVTYRITNDSAIFAHALCRSIDKGRSWLPMKEVYRLTTFIENEKWINVGSIGIDRATGRVHILWSYGSRAPTDPTVDIYHQKKLYSQYSDDNCYTWSNPIEITEANPGGAVPNREWIIPGPQTLVCMQYGPYAGYMVGTFNSRDTIPTHSTPRILYCKDGVNWHVGASFDDAVAANFWAGESAIVEWGTNGSLYINSRFSSLGVGGDTSTRTLTRGHQICNNIMSGIIPTLADMKDTGAVIIPTSPCTWSTCWDDEGVLYAIGPNMTTERARIGIWYSLPGDRDTAGLPTFRRGGVLEYGFSSYTAVLFDAELQQFIVLLEWSVSYNEEGSVYRQYTTPIRFNKAWAKATPDIVPVVTDLQFNENTSGVMDSSGHVVMDYGTHDSRAKGGTMFSYDSTGIIVTNTSGTVGVLAENQSSGDLIGGNYSPWKDSFTFEGVVTMPIGAAAAISYLTYLGGNRFIGFNVPHNIYFEMRDGATTVSLIGTSAWNDGLPHAFCCTLNRVDNKLRIYKDGVLEATSSGALGAGLPVLAIVKACFGGTDTATNRLPQDFHITRLTYTRGIAKTSNFMTVASAAATKVPLETMRHYTPNISANDPSTISGLVLRIADPRIPAGIDRYSGTDYGRNPLVRGHGRSTFLNSVSGKGKWKATNDGNSTFKSWTLDYDNVVGWHYRLSYDRANPTPGVSAAGINMPQSQFGTELNMFQNNVSFSHLSVFKILTNPANAHYISSIGAGSAIGHRFFIDNTTMKLNITITKDNGGNASSRRIDAVTPTGIPAFALDTWYALLITGHGIGAPVQTRIGTFPGSLGAPSWSTAYLTPNAAQADGTYNTGDPLTLFVNNSSNGTDCRVAGVWIWDNPVDSAPNLAKLSAFLGEQAQSTPPVLSGGSLIGYKDPQGFIIGR